MFKKTIVHENSMHVIYFLIVSFCFVVSISKPFDFELLLYV